MQNEDVILLNRLLGAAHRTSRMAKRQTDPSKKRPPFALLGMLRQFGPQRIGDIAHFSQISQPAATKMVAGLEAEGLVRRAEDPTDGRASVISVTQAGSDAIDEWMSEIAAIVVGRYQPLTEADRAALLRTAQILESGLDN